MADSKPAGSNVREIRLGLVCYGGVSLAIYMHGITKELQKLVIASRALEADPEHNPFPPKTVEHVYWRALRASQSEDGALPRVVIDVIAGTSAGGINGVILSKALAHDLSQDALRDLWFEKGDIRQLLGGSKLQRTKRIFGFVNDLRRRRAQGLLDGKAMLGWLLDALKDMDSTRASPYFTPAGARSLMPDGHPLQLFVTTTDYYGYRQSMTIEDPPTVTERRNRHVFEFNYRREPSGETTQFDQRFNSALAFAARATSSFPGAFPPLRVADAPNLPDTFEDEFFRAYGLAGAKARDTFFMDGGVLNNYPFRPAIDAIVRLRAESEVSRYLLYLQPDPGTEAENPQGELPDYFGIIWAGLSKVAASQPILEELIAARSFNEKVRRVEELVASSRDEITGLLEKLLDRSLGEQLPNANAAELRALRDGLDDRAQEQAGYLYEPYLQLRAHSIVEQFAFGICQLCSYQEETSNVAFLVRLIIDAWARDRKLIGEQTDDTERDLLLSRFDLGYTRRRLAFVLQGINALYEDARQGQIPRGDLDRAKVALYNHIDQLKELIGASKARLNNTVVAKLQSLFLGDSLTDAIAHGGNLVQFAEAFVKKNGADMDDLAGNLGELLRAAKDQLHASLYGDFQTITADWPPAQREEVVLRYLGFPFWDAMIYPITALSEAGELRPLQIVRVSPNDSTRLGLRTAKDKLKGVDVAHFGAFFKREWRENDYLWGRLDAAERLLGLVLHGEGDLRASDSVVKPALAAILAEERPALTSVTELIDELDRKVAALPD